MKLQINLKIMNNIILNKGKLLYLKFPTLLIADTFRGNRYSFILFLLRGALNN